MIAGLVEAGFLETRQLPHGGMMLQLSQQGQRALADPVALQSLAARLEQQARKQTTGRSTKGSAPVPVDVAAISEDDPLYKRLCAWRLQKARDLGLPPFMVAHNSLLRNIAAARPRTESQLLAIKGMGPRKLEQHGAELLQLVREQPRE
jgi:ATP-dependent DNA helicase RecQ